MTNFTATPYSRPKNKRTFLKVGIAITGLLLMTGCASLVSGALSAGMNYSNDDKDIGEKTAKYFGTSTQNIRISAVEQNGLVTSYQAKYSGKIYSCAIYYWQVECQQPGGQGVTSGSKAKDSPMSPMQAQIRLNELGYPVGTPDGVFGNKTVAQLKQFQKVRGLPISGKLDDATGAALR